MKAKHHSTDTGFAFFLIILILNTTILWDEKQENNFSNSGMLKDLIYVSDENVSGSLSRCYVAHSVYGFVPRTEQATGDKTVARLWFDPFYPEPIPPEDCASEILRAAGPASATNSLGSTLVFIDPSLKVTKIGGH
jgi:hypothetical protein